jgi:hypothetical protein
MTAIDFQVGPTINSQQGDIYPVMKLLPFPAKKTVAARYSSGVEIRPNGL